MFIFTSTSIGYLDLPRQLITSNPVGILHRFGTWQGPTCEFVDLFTSSVDGNSEVFFVLIVQTLFFILISTAYSC